MTGIEIGLVALGEFLLRSLGVAADAASLGAMDAACRDRVRLAELIRKCVERATHELSGEYRDVARQVTRVSPDWSKLAEVTPKLLQGTDLRAVSEALTGAFDVTWRGGKAGDTVAVVEAVLRTAFEHLQADLPDHAAAWHEAESARGVRLEGQSGLIRAAVAPTPVEEAQKLLSATAGTLHRTEPHRKIQDLTLHRTVDDDLLRAALAGSLLVLGEPGSGKTGALHELVRALIDSGERVVFLSADHLQAASLGALRDDLGLRHELHDVMAGMTADTDSRAFLVIDALDKAPETAMPTYLCLIGDAIQSLDRWHVVAAMRTFDASHRGDVQALFPGEPVQGTSDPALARERVRHLKVDLLDLADGSEARTRVGEALPELSRVLESADPATLRVLANPYNLSLAADLIGTNQLPPERLYRSRLLDAYWKARVRGVGGQRTDALTVLSRQMLDTRSLLALRRDLLAAGADGGVLDGLLRDGVLRATGLNDDQLSFEHNVLADYAVARLRFLSSAGAGADADLPIVQELASAPDAVIFAYPSLDLAFEQLWWQDRDRFWTTAFALLACPSISAVGQVAPWSQVSRHSASIADLEPLLCEPGAAGTTHETALRHIIGAAIAEQGLRPLVGEGAGPWCELAARLVAQEDLESLIDLGRRLLAVLIDSVSDASSAERKDLASAGRVYLQRALAAEPPIRARIIVGIQAVCRTFSEDPQGAAALLRQFLEPRRVEAYGWDELQWLARELEHIEDDGELLGDLYQAAFSYREKSGEATEMVASQIMGFRSNRAQDYRMALWQLGEYYPRFLQLHPARAVEAMLHALEEYIARQHGAHKLIRPSNSLTDPYQMRLIGREVQVIPDRSVVWDSTNLHALEPEVRMLNAVGEALGAAAASHNRDLWRALVGHLADRGDLPAVVFRRLLASLSSHPGSLLDEAPALLREPTLYAALDTCHPARELLTVTHPRLNAKLKADVEKALLEARDLAWGGTDPASRWNRILGCLDPTDVVRGEIKRAIADRPTDQPVGAGDPPVAIWSGVGVRDEEGYLSDQVGRPPTEAELALRQHTQGLEDFCGTHADTPPTESACQDVLPLLKRALDLLPEARPPKYAPLHADMAWHYVAECAARIAWQADQLSGDAPQTVVRALKGAANHPLPERNPEDVASWSEGAQGWGVPSPRSESVPGILALARSPARLDDLRGVIEALTDLGEHPVVLYQAACYLRCLYESDRQLMWQLIDSFLVAPMGVRIGLIWSTLVPLLDHQPSDVFKRCSRLLDAGEPGPCDDVRRGCAQTIGLLYVRHDLDDAWELLQAMVCDPQRWSLELAALCELLDEYEDRPDADDRLWDTLAAVADASARKLRELVDAKTESPPERWVGDLVHALDSLWMGARKRAERARGADEAAALLEHVDPLIRAMGTFPHPHVIHDMVEMLGHLLPLRPDRVLPVLAQVVECGEQTGYETETLAADEVVRIAEEVLASHRSLLARDEVARGALLRILDVFVRAGWPRARSLVYRLGQVHR